MPHKNAIKQLKLYGKLAQTLERIVDDPNGLKVLKQLSVLHQKHDLRPVIDAISRDKYAYNRELAAGALVYLWWGWRSIPYKDEIDYLNKIKAFVRNLQWSLPLIQTLIQDKAAGPKEFAILVLREVAEASLEVGVPFREYVILALKDKSVAVRLEAVKNICHLYPFGDEGYEVEEKALKGLIEATYDKDENVRDWACFCFASSMDLNSAAIEKALRDALEREDADSDVYMESVIALAKRKPDREVTQIILINLERDDWGTRWIEAAVASKSSKCRAVIIQLQELLLRDNPQDSRLKAINEVLANNGW